MSVAMPSGAAHTTAGAQPAPAIDPVEVRVREIAQQITHLKTTFQLEAAVFARPAKHPWSWRACDDYGTGVAGRVSDLQQRILQGLPADRTPELLESLKLAEYTGDMASATAGMAYIRATLLEALITLQQIDSECRILRSADELSEPALRELKNQIPPLLAKIQKVLTETADRILQDKFLVNSAITEDLEINLCGHVERLLVRLQADGLLEVGPEYYPRFFFTSLHIYYVHLHLERLKKAGRLDMDTMFTALRAFPEQLQRNILLESLLQMQALSDAVCTNEAVVVVIHIVLQQFILAEDGILKVGIHTRQCSRYLTEPITPPISGPSLAESGPPDTSEQLMQYVRRMIAFSASRRHVPVRPPEGITRSISESSAFPAGGETARNRGLPPLDVGDGSAMRHTGLTSSGVDLTASGVELAGIVDHTGETPTPSYNQGVSGSAQ